LEKHQAYMQIHPKQRQGILHTLANIAPLHPSCKLLLTETLR